MAMQPRKWVLVRVLSAALISLVAEVMSSYGFSGKVALAGQKAEIDEPLCYMTTSEGRIVNLTQLCGSSVPPKSPECSRNSVAANLAIAKVNYDGNVLTGTVSNQSCKTVKNLKINYTVLDDLGNQIDNGFIVAQPQVVPPGGTAAFRGVVTGGVKVQATHVDWSD